MPCRPLSVCVCVFGMKQINQIIIINVKVRSNETVRPVIPSAAIG